MRAVSDQCLKQHHHRDANQSSAAAMLTKRKPKIKPDTYLHVPPPPTPPPPLPIPPLSIFVINFGYSLHSDVIFEWYLMQFLILQKNVCLKSIVYNFSRMVLNVFQALNYQNDPFYTDCLVLLHNYFAFYSFKHLLRFEFCLFCF